MRNADHDLKICNAATRGPWYREKTGATFKGFSTETIIADTAPYCTKNRIYADAGDSYPASDADFIALSREALPYWIKRAQGLEKVLDDACKMLAENTGSCPWDMLDQYMDCGDSCDDDTALCWQKYFLKTKTVEQSRQEE